MVTQLDLRLQPVLADGERGSSRSQAVLETTRDHGLDRERLGGTGWISCVGDFSLDFANSLRLIWIFETWGLDRLTASCEFNLS